MVSHFDTNHFGKGLWFYVWWLVGWAGIKAVSILRSKSNPAHTKPSILGNNRLVWTPRPFRLLPDRRMWIYPVYWYPWNCWKVEPTEIWKLTFKKTPPPKHFRGCGWNSEWMLKGWKPLIHLAFWENPSTFKMVHIFNSNKKEKNI